MIKMSSLYFNKTLVYTQYRLMGANIVSQEMYLNVNGAWKKLTPYVKALSAWVTPGVVKIKKTDWVIIYTRSPKIYFDGRFYTYTYTEDGIFTAEGISNIDILLVGGGGGGGYDGGGGGGGGVIFKQNQSVTSGTQYNVNVGSSGAGGLFIYNGDMSGKNGGNTSFNSTLIAYGGGGGGGYSYAGKSGGCGGGGYNPYAGGAGTQGFNGGSGGANDQVNATYGGCGGGGGMRSAGLPGLFYSWNDMTNRTLSGIGGNGGAGVDYSISGTSVIYGSGGGGKGRNSNYGGIADRGGKGGINAGNGGSTSINSTAGVANTGGGGGGGLPSSSGGSGLAIIKFQPSFINFDICTITDSTLGLNSNVIVFEDTTIASSPSTYLNTIQATIGDSTSVITSNVTTIFENFTVDNLSSKCLNDALGGRISESLNPIITNTFSLKAFEDFTVDNLSNTYLNDAIGGRISESLDLTTTNTISLKTFEDCNTFDSSGTFLNTAMAKSGSDFMDIPSSSYNLNTYELFDSSEFI